LSDWYLQCVWDNNNVNTHKEWMLIIVCFLLAWLSRWRANFVVGLIEAVTEKLITTCQCVSVVLCMMQNFVSEPGRKCTVLPHIHAKSDFREEREIYREWDEDAREVVDELFHHFFSTYSSYYFFFFFFFVKRTIRAMDQTQTFSNNPNLLLLAESFFSFFDADDRTSHCQSISPTLTQQTQHR
jgi:hypothetical protein